jgi:glycosyltransferase involved in cell wall biosynthesis
MTEPLVSIISPTYNHEPFIAACIESVLAQSYRHWEMTVIDDGSTEPPAVWWIARSRSAPVARAS